MSERRHALSLNPATTYAEDQAAERDEATAWETLFIAAITFDDVLPDTGSPATELIKLMASLAAPAPGAWIDGECDGGVAYYSDGRGRVTAMLTAYGQVVPAPRVALGWPLPEAPA